MTRSCLFGSRLGLDLMVAVVVFCVIFMALEPGAEADVGLRWAATTKLKLCTPEGGTHISGATYIKLKVGKNIKKVFVFIDDKYIASGPPYTIFWTIPHGVQRPTSNHQ